MLAEKPQGGMWPARDFVVENQAASHTSGTASAMSPTTQGGDGRPSRRETR
jgi:hypothetical protein